MWQLVPKLKNLMIKLLPITNKVIAHNKKGKKGQKVIITNQATFEEGDEMIQMQVQASDGELDSDEDSDSSEDENEDDQSTMGSDNESVNQQSEEESNNNHTQSEAETNEMDEEEIERRQKYRKKKKQAKQERRANMEQKLDTLSTTLQAMQEMMAQNGMLKNKNSAGTLKNTVNSDNESDTTIYQAAVNKAQNEQTVDSGFQIRVDPEITFNVHDEKRNSSSPDDWIDTSDELMEIEDNAHSNFIAECAAAAAGNSRSQKRKEDDGDRVIREAEASKARLFATPGNEQNSLGCLNNWGQYRVTQSAAVDENYMVVGTHVDQSLQQKIINNEHVDFSKLLPRNRGMSSAAEDHRVELVSKRGLTYFMPVSDREVTQISNFSKWEQAFRVFSNVYTRAYPHRASELIQYNHIIHTAVSSFI